ncbi:hypothetical protein SprV_0100364600 [Sparganum proliferum]
MDNEWQPKQLFHSDFATSSRRHGVQVHHYRDALKTSLKRPQINLANWEDLKRDRPTWRKIVKTGVASHDANRIIAVKAKRKARKSPLRTILNVNAQPPPTCPRCQRTFRAPVGLAGHLRINCSTWTTTAAVPSPDSASFSTPKPNSGRTPGPQLPFSSFSSSSSSSSSTTASTSVAVTLVPTTTAHNSDTLTNISPH